MDANRAAVHVVWMLAVERVHYHGGNEFLIRGGNIRFCPHLNGMVSSPSSYSRRRRV